MVGIPALAFFDGIEMAGDGLFPFDLAFVVGLFKYTFYDPLLITHPIGTYFVFNCWRNPAKLTVVAIQSIFFYFFDTFLCHQWLDNFIALVYLIKFLICQWCARITVFTTASFAFAEVANKVKNLCKNKG
jgi:hypothetical protein